MRGNPFRAMLLWLLNLTDEVDREYRQRKELYLEGIEPTINRLEGALQNLQEAVGAVDELKTRARRAAEEVERLQTDRQQKLDAYQEAMAMLNQTNELLQRDKKRLQQALGLNPWRERWWGFVMGVLASIVTIWIQDGWAWAKTFAQARNWL